MDPCMATTASSVQGPFWVSLEQNEVTGLVMVLGLVRSVLGARLHELILERGRLGAYMSKVFV